MPPGNPRLPVVAERDVRLRPGCGRAAVQARPIRHPGREVCDLVPVPRLSVEQARPVSSWGMAAAAHRPGPAAPPSLQRRSVAAAAPPPVAASPLGCCPEWPAPEPTAVSLFGLTAAPYGWCVGVSSAHAAAWPSSLSGLRLSPRPSSFDGCGDGLSARAVGLPGDSLCSSLSLSAQSQ